MRALVNLLHEIGQLARTPRTGFAFLGSGQQSVAEHSYTTAMTCFVLADLCEEPVDREKLMMLALCHDLLEARTGDLNYVYKRYMKPDNEKVLQDLPQGCSSGQKIADYIREFEEGETLEARLAHDADQLELLLVLKREYDTGNPRAIEWFDIVLKRVKTPQGQQLAKQIRETPSDEWWIADKTDRWWVTSKS